MAKNNTGICKMRTTDSRQKLYYVEKANRKNIYRETTQSYVDRSKPEFISQYPLSIDVSYDNLDVRIYYMNLLDNVESTTIRLALYIKSGYTTFWIWWHKTLEKRVGLSSNWDTLEEKRDVRHINLGFYEEWLRTKAQLKYMAKTYTQTFTKIYMVTKPDFVVKPDTEYVVIIMRVDGEFRTIACPREIFLETKLGDAIMSEDNTTLTNMGLGGADISGFSEGKISPYVYGLITKSNATSTIWNKVVAAITQNTSGVRIASIVQMSRILLPKDIVKMIPLNVLPQQGKSLPEYMSPEASIWAAMVGFVTEVGRLLCELFMALANFLVKLIETIVEWGLKLLGALLEVLGAAKYLFAMALCVWSWTKAAMFLIIIFSVNTLLRAIGYSVGDLSVLEVCLDFDSGSVLMSVCVGYIEYYGFPIAVLSLDIFSSFFIGDDCYSLDGIMKIPFVPFMGALTSLTHTGELLLLGRRSPTSTQVSPIYEYVYNESTKFYQSSTVVALFYGILCGIITLAYIAEKASKPYSYVASAIGTFLLLCFSLSIAGSIKWNEGMISTGNKMSTYGWSCFTEFVSGVSNLLASAIYLAMLIGLVFLLHEVVGGGKYDWLIEAILFMLLPFIMSRISLPSNEILQFVRAFIILMEAGFSFVIIELLRAAVGRYGGGSMQYLFLVLDDIKRPLLVMTFVIFLAHVALGLGHLYTSTQTDLEFTPPSIQADIKKLDSTKNYIAEVNATIEVSDNKQLNYIVVDLAGGGGSYYPAHPEFPTGAQSRIYVPYGKILTLVAIHRLEDGTLDIYVLGNSYSLIGNGSVHDNITWTHTKDNVKYSGWLFFNITRSGENIEIVLNGTVYSENIKSGETLYLVAWACDWIDNEALLVSDPQVERTYITAYKPSVLSEEGPTLPANITSRVFTIGLKPYLCTAKYVGIELSSPNPVTLTISNTSSTYSSSHGFWACVAINADDWDLLCRVGPARVVIGDGKVDIHFLRYPFYYTIFGAFVIFILTFSMILELWNENEEAS